MLQSAIIISHAKQGLRFLIMEISDPQNIDERANNQTGESLSYSKWKPVNEPGDRILNHNFILCTDLWPFCALYWVID